MELLIKQGAVVISSCNVASVRLLKISFVTQNLVVYHSKNSKIDISFIFFYKYIRQLRKNLPHHQLKKLKRFLLQSYAVIQLATIHLTCAATGNPINFYFISTVDKSHHRPVISPFFGKNFVKSFPFSLASYSTLDVSQKTTFLLFLIYSGYANYNAQGAFVAIFFICNDLLNSLRSVTQP